MKITIGKKIPKLPEGFIKCNLTYGSTFNDKGEISDSFCDSGLNKPGTVIFMESGKIYLIGHINPLAGVCDDCVEFGRGSIVMGYKEIEWSK